jgi:hypothetical protein
MIRPLLLTDELRARCRRLQQFSEDPKNWYRFGEVEWVPGDRSEYVLDAGAGYKVVFTITYCPAVKPQPFRHMTISVPGPNYPHPEIVLLMANLLGFTGAELDRDIVVKPGPWGVAIDEDEGCVIVQQPYEPPVQ